MKTLRNALLAVLAVVAVGCDPYSDANTGPGKIIAVISSGHGDPVEATANADRTAWTLTGVPSQDVEDENGVVIGRTASNALVFVKFDKLLDGFAIQESATSCVPAAALALTQVAGPAPAACPAGSAFPTERWLACYNPSAPVPNEGASVVIFKACESPASLGSGWGDLASLSAGATYTISATARDKEGRSYPINVTLTTDP